MYHLPIFLKNFIEIQTHVAQLAYNLLCSLGWPWTPDPPTSTQFLGLQASVSLISVVFRMLGSNYILTLTSSSKEDAGLAGKFTPWPHEGLTESRRVALQVTKWTKKQRQSKAQHLSGWLRETINSTKLGVYFSHGHKSWKGLEHIGQRPQETFW